MSSAVKRSTRRAATESTASAVTRAFASVQRPLQVRSNVECRHRYRFQTGGSTVSAVPITANSLAGAVGTICYGTNSTVRCIAGSVKIDQIEIWSSWAGSGAGGAPPTCSVEWLSSAGSSNNREISDTTLSTSTPAHVCTGPPKQSLASFWQTAGSSTTLCLLTAPARSIVDVVVSFILEDEDSDDASITVSTGTLGHMYYLSLDSNTTNYFVPVALNTTS
jgi:hypothetical protein